MSRNSGTTSGSKSRNPEIRLDDYDANARFEQWKQGFTKALEERLKANPIKPPQPRDVTDIKLINAEDETQELEKRVHDELQKSSGNEFHKTNEFHDIQDAKQKLDMRLDGIDVSGNADYGRRRTELYRKLRNLSEKLSNKLHTGHSDCQQCVQVKVVELNLDK